MPVKINPIFIPKDERPEFKPFCDICKKYMIYIKEQGYECPVCGVEYDKKEDDSDKLTSIRDTNPKIYSKKEKKQKRSPDFPASATIKEDNEYPSGYF